VSLAQQEAELMKRYGGLPSKKHLLLQKAGRKCFDSADWALSKAEGRSPEAVGSVSTPQATEALPIKRLEPPQDNPLGARKLSNLSDRS